MVPLACKPVQAGSSDRHLGPRGSPCGKNERDNPSNVRNLLPSGIPPCHVAPGASSKSNEIQIFKLAFPVLNAFSASQITSILSRICSFSSCADLKLEVAAIPYRETSPGVSRGTQTSATTTDVLKDVASAAEVESHPQSSNSSPNQPNALPNRSPSALKVDSSAQCDPSVFAYHMAPRSLANTDSVDQAVDATEPSPFRPALLPDYIPHDAKSWFYWHLSLNRVNTLRDYLLNLVASFNGEIATYFAKLKGPRLKTLDFMKHPFPFPALLGLRKLHAYLAYALFVQQGTLPLTPSEAAEYDDFDNEFDDLWSFEHSNDRNFRNVSYVPPGDPCSNCGDDGASSRCTQCKIAVYCDRTCQSAHWKVHKATCKAPPDAPSPAASRPPGGA